MSLIGRDHEHAQAEPGPGPFRRLGEVTRRNGKGHEPAGVWLDEATWDGWRQAIAAAIDERRQQAAENMPADIPAEIVNAPLRPVPHVWETRTLTAGLTVECCVHGDAVRRRDGRELPCRGPARIDLRSPR